MGDFGVGFCEDGSGGEVLLPSVGNPGSGAQIWRGGWACNLALLNFSCAAHFVPRGDCEPAPDGIAWVDRRVRILRGCRLYGIAGSATGAVMDGSSSGHESARDYE